MDKNGFSQVDFAISFAIFLVYLMFLFVYLKPISLPSYSTEVLINIVRDNFLKDASWTITKTPLFITKCNSCDGASVRDVCVDRFPFGSWNGNFCFWNENNADVGNAGEYSQSDDEYGCRNGLALSYALSGKRNIFWVVHSDDNEWGGTCIVPGFSCNNYDSINNVCRFFTGYDADYGTTYFLDGISSEKFNGFGNYESKKSEWGFPENMDFSIHIYDTEYAELASYNAEGEKGAEQRNVFVREWNDFLLGSKAQTTPIIINIRMWQ